MTDIHAVQSEFNAPADGCSHCERGKREYIQSFPPAPASGKNDAPQKQQCGNNLLKIYKTVFQMIIKSQAFKAYAAGPAQQQECDPLLSGRTVVPQESNPKNQKQDQCKYS